jgi:TolB-like protein/Flp pilus assembly protein TadD
MNQLIAELRRRKVLRVAAVYAAAAFVVVQVADIAFPALHLPGWTLTFVVALSILGFPVAVVLAWAFDLTPDGVQRTSPPRHASAAVEPAGRRAGYVGLGILVGLVGVGGYTGVRVLGSGEEMERSIAVLPFENLSADPENAFFASGFHDELITQLAKVADLRVISRTSVVPYVGSGRNLQEIAAALGVRTIVEGSVQRSGGRLRVNARLVDTRTGQPLWTETYDREVSDAFAIQSSLALEIVGALRARLAPGERERIEEEPTSNADAWALYLRAADYLTRPAYTVENFRPAEELLNLAVQLDPSFALAYARLAYVHAAMIWFAYDEGDERRASARQAVERAVALKPDLPATHVAKGYYHYWVERDYGRALDELERARQMMPGDGSIVQAIAFVQRRQGRWEEALASFARVTELNPRDVQTRDEMFWTYHVLNRHAEAEQAYRNALAIAPEEPIIRVRGAQRALESGDTSLASTIRQRVPHGFDPQGLVTFMGITVAAHRGDFAGAVRILDGYPAPVIATQSRYFPLSLIRGMLLHQAGDRESARREFAAASRLLEQATGERPGDPRVHAALALAYAAAGRREDALREAAAAQSLMAGRTDAMLNPRIEMDLALVNAWAGDLDAAVAQLRRLGTVPNGPQQGWLQVSHEYAPLRSHPGFRALAGM